MGTDSAAIAVPSLGYTKSRKIVTRSAHASASANLQETLYPPEPPPRVRKSLPISQKYALPASSHQKAHDIAGLLYGDDQLDIQKTANEGDNVNISGSKSAIDDFIERERQKTEREGSPPLRNAVGTAEEGMIQSLCSACSSDVTSESPSIICCSTTCKHIFHPSCLGDAGPIDNQPWFCTLCKLQQEKELSSKRENDICICQRKVIEENSIFCDCCHRWYHPACINVSDRAFNQLITSKEDYCCPSCTDARSNKYRISWANIDGKENILATVHQIHRKSQNFRKSQNLFFSKLYS